MDMININGNIQAINKHRLTENRGFLYGDALFDTLIFRKNTPVFIEAHYFRLLAGMRQLRMEIPIYFTQVYWEKEIRKTLDANKYTEARVRTSIFRDSGGLYTPTSNKSGFLIQVSEWVHSSKTNYNLGVYKENYLNTASINNIKTTNRLPNVLASIFSKENHFDTCVLLNRKKKIAEAIHANIFLVFKNQLLTPPLSAGCIKGIVREKIIAIVQDLPEFQLIERDLEVYDLQKADEVFLTNSVIGIQAVTQYKRKSYKTYVSGMLQQELEKLV